MRSDIITFEKFKENYNPSHNKTLNILTIYEKTCAIGLRSQQIAEGAISTLLPEEVDKLQEPYKIAEEELKQGKIPYIVCRKLHNGTKEYWKISDLIQ